VTSPRRILITGGQGRLARVAAPLFTDAGWDVVAIGREGLDVTDRQGVARAVSDLRPDTVLNLAAWTNMTACERDPHGARRVNTLGVRHVAEAARAVGAHLCQISSDYVFDGTKADGPYAETDRTSPISVYGETKRDGELEAGDGTTIVRTAWMSGPFAPNVVHAAVAQAADPDAELRFVDDQRGSPTAAADLVRALIPLVRERVAGLFHITNAGSASWFDIARVAIEAAGHDPERVRRATSAEIEPHLLGLRPRYSVLGSTALQRSSIPAPPPWEPSFARLARELRTAATVPPPPG